MRTKSNIFVLVIVMFCLSLVGCGKNSVCDSCGEKKTCTEIIVEGKKYNLCDACQTKILSENLAHLDEATENSTEVAEEMMTEEIMPEEIIDAIQETAPTDNLQPTVQSDDLQESESLNDHSEPVVLSFEEELLYGHWWGETENEYKSKSEAEIILGYPVSTVECNFSYNNELYLIGYTFTVETKDDKEAIKQICIDALGEPKEADEIDNEYSWYVGSLHYVLNITYHTADLYVINDRYTN